MAQSRAPPGGPRDNTRNPYAQRQYFDNDPNGRDAHFQAIGSTTALIGAEESQPNLAQFPPFGDWSSNTPPSVIIADALLF